MAQTWPLFNLFSFFSHSINKFCFNFNNINWKSVDGALGIRTRGHSIKGKDITTELYLPPQIFINSIFHFVVHLQKS